MKCSCINYVDTAKLQRDLEAGGGSKRVTKGVHLHYVLGVEGNMKSLHVRV